MRNKWLNYAWIPVGLIVLAFAWWRFLPPEDAAESESVEANSVPNELRLTTQKLASTRIDVGTANRHALQQKLTLPGRLTYNSEQHVVLRAACEGILVDMLARPGDTVTKGQVLAVLSSPGVAAARAQVRSAIGNLSLAKQKRERSEELCAGVERLVEKIRQGKSPEEIRAALEGEPLGNYREKLITAYTRSLLAEQAASSSREAAESGALPGRIQREREAERQAAEAAVVAVSEQSLYESQLDCKQTMTELSAAERAAELSFQELDLMLGPAAAKASEAELALIAEEGLPLVNILAPIDGTIEDRPLAVNERVTPASEIYTLADTSKLWAVADVRQNDWLALSARPGTMVTVVVPAMQSYAMQAEVLRSGRTVDPQSGAATLVARLTASDPQLRPGLFVRMSVPIGSPIEALAVPEQAVVAHESQSFVFVVAGDPQEPVFKRVDVQTGITVDGLTEITDGLAAGDSIAISGVFKLKSELLLAGEEE